MKEFKRVVILVADGLGVGEAPDAKDYGDEGANTLGNVAKTVQGISLPHLEKLGIGNLGSFPGIAANRTPEAVIGRLAERSAGKDTTTGHWEIAGLVTHEGFSLFPEGFPKKLVDEFLEQTGLPGVLCNTPASGTEIIQRLGVEHLETGKPILYTSGDSVFQVAASEDDKVFGLKKLYQVCEIARKLTLPYRIGRVIARPFVGISPDNFRRTENRKDYSLRPPRTCLNVLQDSGVKVCGVGKIEDIFDHQGIDESNHTGNNADSLRATLSYLEGNRNEKAFIFVNLVDFDMLYGHRRDPIGFAKSLSELDNYLPKLLSELGPEDCLMITGDHGCDPTFRGTDHTREYVPLIAYRPTFKGKFVGDRSSFSDIAATMIDGYQIKNAKEVSGASFLWEFQA